MNDSDIGPIMWLWVAWLVGVPAIAAYVLIRGW